MDQTTLLTPILESLASLARLDCSRVIDCAFTNANRARRRRLLQPVRVLIIPSAFKDSFTAWQAANSDLISIVDSLSPGVVASISSATSQTRASAVALLHVSRASAGVAAHAVSILSQSSFSRLLVLCCANGESSAIAAELQQAAGGTCVICVVGSVGIATGEGGETGHAPLLGDEPSEDGLEVLVEARTALQACVDALMSSHASQRLGSALAPVLLCVAVDCSTAVASVKATWEAECGWAVSAWAAGVYISAGRLRQVFLPLLADSGTPSSPSARSLRKASLSTSAVVEALGALRAAVVQDIGAAGGDDQTPDPVFLQPPGLRSWVRDPAAMLPPADEPAPLIYDRAAPTSRKGPVPSPPPSPHTTRRESDHVATAGRTDPLPGALVDECEVSPADNDTPLFARRGYQGLDSGRYSAASALRSNSFVGRVGSARDSPSLRSATFVASPRREWEGQIPLLRSSSFVASGTGRSAAGSSGSAWTHASELQAAPEGSVVRARASSVTIAGHSLPRSAAPPPVPTLRHHLTGVQDGPGDVGPPDVSAPTTITASLAPTTAIDSTDAPASFAADFDERRGADATLAVPLAVQLPSRGEIVASEPPSDADNLRIATLELAVRSLRSELAACEGRVAEGQVRGDILDSRLADAIAIRDSALTAARDATLSMRCHLERLASESMRSTQDAAVAIASTQGHVASIAARWMASSAALLAERDAAIASAAGDRARLEMLAAQVSELHAAQRASEVAAAIALEASESRSTALESRAAALAAELGVCRQAEADSRREAEQLAESRRLLLSDVSRLDETNAALSARCIRAESDAACLTTRLGNAQARECAARTEARSDVEAVQARYGDLELRCRDAAAAASVATLLSDDLARRLAAAEEELAKSTSRAVSLEASVKSLRVEFERKAACDAEAHALSRDAVQIAHDAEKVRLVTELADAVAARNEAETQSASLKTQLQSLYLSHAADLAAQLSALEASIAARATLESKVATAEARLQESSSALASVAEAYSCELTEQQRRASVAESRVDMLAAEATALKAELRSERARANEAESGVAVATGALAGVSDELSIARDRIAALESSLAAAEAAQSRLALEAADELKRVRAEAAVHQEASALALTDAQSAVAELRGMLSSSLIVVSQLETQRDCAAATLAEQAMQSAVASLQAEGTCFSLQLRADKLQAAVAHTSRDAAKSELAAAAVGTQLEEANVRLTEAWAVAETLRLEVAALQARLAQTSALCSSHVAELAAQATALEASIAAQASLGDKIAAAEARLQESSSTLMSVTEAYSGELVEQQVHLNVAHLRVESLTAEATALNAELRSQRARADAAESSVAEAAVALAGVSGELSNARDRIAALESSVAAAKDAQSRLALEAVDELKRARTEAAAQQQASKLAWADAQASLSLSLRHVSQLEAQRDSAATALAEQTIGAAVSSLQAEVAFSALRLRIEDLELALTESRSIAVAFSTQHDTLRHDSDVRMREARAAAETLRLQVADIEAQLRCAQAVIVASEQRASSAETQSRELLADAEVRYESLRRDLIAAQATREADAAQASAALSLRDIALQEALSTAQTAQLKAAQLAADQTVAYQQLQAALACVTLERDAHAASLAAARTELSHSQARLCAAAAEASVPEVRAQGLAHLSGERFAAQSAVHESGSAIAKSEAALSKERLAHDTEIAILRVTLESARARSLSTGHASIPRMGPPAEPWHSGSTLGTGAVTDRSVVSPTTAEPVGDNVERLPFASDFPRPTTEPHLSLLPQAISLSAAHTLAAALASVPPGTPGVRPPEISALVPVSALPLSANPTAAPPSSPGLWASRAPLFDVSLSSGLFSTTAAAPTATAHTQAPAVAAADSLSLGDGYEYSASHLPCTPPLSATSLSSVLRPSLAVGLFDVVIDSVGAASPRGGPAEEPLQASAAVQGRALTSGANRAPSARLGPAATAFAPVSHAADVEQSAATEWRCKACGQRPGRRGGLDRLAGPPPPPRFCMACGAPVRAALDIAAAAAAAKAHW